MTTRTPTPTRTKTRARKATYTDPLGQTVPAKYVAPYDRARDAAAEAIAERWRAEERRLVELHRWTDQQIRAVQDASAADPAARAIGAGERGNVQFRSFDGSIVVAMDIQAREEFEPQLIAVAQRLVQEVIAEGRAAIEASAAGGLAVDVAEIAARAFTPRKSGRLDMARVRELTTLQVSHPKWRRAMEIIGSATRLVGMRRYIRVAVRETPSAEPRGIYLDMAAAGTTAEMEDLATAAMQATAAALTSKGGAL